MDKQAALDLADSLTLIRGYGDLARRATDPAMVRGYLDRIDQAERHVSEIVRGLVVGDITVDGKREEQLSRVYLDPCRTPDQPVIKRPARRGVDFVALPKAADAVDQ